MTQINKLKIGLALNAIGLMLDDESYERIKGRLTEIEDIVKAEPDTDDPEGEPTEIIRCKDCKWFNQIGCSIEIIDETDKPTEDDFCSFAERVKGGANNMTRSEMIYELENNGHVEGDDRFMEAYHAAVNSLKIDEMYDLTMEDPDAYIHRSVIEDIKAGIAALRGERIIDFVNPKSVVDTVLEIIDKHTGDES